jgi:hypothetical protein
MSYDYTRIEGEEYLYRDNESNSIINTNSNEYEEFKRRAREKNEINKLKDEVSELKSLIKELIKKD